MSDATRQHARRQLRHDERLTPAAPRDGAAGDGAGDGAARLREILEPMPYAWPEPQPIAGCAPRHRACCVGTAVETTTAEEDDRLGFGVRLEDGTGSLLLVFSGRTAVPGIVVGAQLQVEGMVGLVGGELTILNPRYRFSG